MVLSSNVRIHFVFAYYFINPLRLVPGFSGIVPMLIVAVKCLIMKRKFKHIWTMKTNVSGVNAKFQVKTPCQSMYIFLPLLRLSFLSSMEAGIKTWIHSLPDPSNKNKIGAVMTTRLSQWMLYSSKMAKYDNVLVVFCSSVILCSGKRQNIDNLDCKR
jgi:hypothetical protein